MPTAIVQVDVESAPSPPRIGDSYSRALVVARRRRRPVGQFYVAVDRSTMDATQYRQGLRRIVESAAWRWKVEDYLGPQPATDLPACTVAVCTRERPEDLTRALTALAALSPPPDEVLVVDNSPATDRTREVVGRFGGIRYVREDRPGLDTARNRALREASFPIVAFCDDDAAPEPEWLAHLLPPFRDPRVSCTTGLTLPLELETPAQEWFERHSPFGRGFVRQVYDGTRHDPLHVGRVGAGVNMAVRRSVLEDLGGFDEALDAGTPSRSGGDHEMFGRILAAGHRIVYEPAAVSWHRHRRSWPELRETLYGYGVGVYALWTRRLLIDREPGVLRHAVKWLRAAQAPALWRAMRRVPGSVPLELQLAQLRGCLRGPGAYLAARRRLRAAKRA